MKKYYFLLLAFSLFITVDAQIISIPDANFKAKLLEASSSSEIAKDLQGNNIKIDVNGDGEIQESEALLIYELTVDGSNISNLTGIEFFINLTYFRCEGNTITSLNLGNLINLTSLDFANNQVTSFDATNLKNIQSLYCVYNRLTSLNVTQLPNLSDFETSGNLLTTLDLTGSTNNLVHLGFGDNPITSFGFDVSVITTLTSLYCYNSGITSLDVRGLTNLKELYCDRNNLGNLDLTGLTKIETLSCGGNNLTSLDVTGLPNLISLFCNNNYLTNLDLTGLSKIEDLFCYENKLTSLEVTGLPNLINLWCESNNLTSLDLTGLTKIDGLVCSYNAFSSLDVSDLKKLRVFSCDGNPVLTSIFMKNGSNENHLNLSNNPNLKYICADDSQINQIKDLITQNGYTNCVINSYCSFMPGGTFYTIKGNNRFDTNNNGCDAADIAASNIKFTITDGTTSGTIISDETGNYSIPVQEGTYTITPVFENPNYFTISPTSINVTFPTAASQFTQDFCITPIGLHQDLEITLMPMEVARPGFDVKYKIIYKNKGNVAQSGTVNLKFNDAVLDLVIASPVISSQTTNNLSWDFTNLAPFETREISLTLNVNTPAETPTVNNGDILGYTAAITSAATDETPIDNTFTLNQTVVNSFDPNDKTCLEGDVITPALIGEYVHYQIRFENTGTYPAENIVVKDIIDLSKFDISTLVPTKASHEFVTKISDGNKVEFIFENINLPFDNATNDGYIAFKIKTLPTLVVGDSFANEANIYFDYNFPILTNKATSTFKTLGTSDFEFSNYFSVYPNPVNDILNIGIKNNIEVKSMAVYDILGQLIIAVPNAQTVSKVDVSRLTTGAYFLKMNTDKGSSSLKFIKN
jgi:Leucine-rich repeat (LRR) protein